jgi:hypothetical protein
MLEEEAAMKLSNGQKAGLVVVGVAAAGVAYMYASRPPPYDSKVPDSPKPEKPLDVTPAVIKTEEKPEIQKMEDLQKKEVADMKLTKPQHMGTHKNWKGEKAEVWFYPSENRYGVIVEWNHNLDTGAKYAKLEDAVAYARGVVGVRT